MDDSTDPPVTTSVDIMEVSPKIQEQQETTPVDPPPEDTDVLPTYAPNPNAAAQSAPMDSDDNRETHFVYVLRRYDKIPDNKVYSPWHNFGGFQWRLLIFPKGNQSSSHDLSVYLECGGPIPRLTAPEYGTTSNGKEVGISPAATNTKLVWSRPAKFSLHLIHPMSTIGRAHLAPVKDDQDPEGGLSDVDVSEGNLGVSSPMLGARQDTPKETSHVFRDNASDWGFLEFAPFATLQPGQYADDDMNIVIMVRIRLVDQLSDNMLSNTPTWDSRKETGFVGFKNQGATCYMNSLLQTLYMVSAFRKAVYNMPLPEPGNENSGSELSYALQKVFYELQFSPTVVKTKKLTESFGWDNTDAFTQHDVQELKLILCDELAEKMKKIAPNRPNTLSTLFQGKLLNYIECVNVDYKSTREEHFSDLSLNVKGCRNIYDSFEKYIEVEMMEGDNRYRADGYEELQDARKGVKFLSLPPVLQLHLKRFEYDFSRFAMVKINDRYEFETELDLSPYVQDSDGRDIYVLHSVLVHIGDVNGGHYHVFIRPQIDVSDGEGKKPSKWYKFDDETVTLVNEQAAVSENFGIGGEKDVANKRTPGVDEDLGNGGLNGAQTPTPNVFQPRPRHYQARRFSNAYMLQYLRKSEVPHLLKPEDKSDIPKELAARISKEREEEEQKQKEVSDQHLYMTVAVAINDNMLEHHGSDLVQWDKVPQLKVIRALLLGELKARLEKEGIVKDARFVRLWKCDGRKNDTMRPDSLVADGVNAQAITDPNSRDPIVQTGYNVPLYPGRLSYYGHDDSLRIFAEDFCSPYCLNAGQAYTLHMRANRKFLDRDVDRMEGIAADNQNISEMETDFVRPVRAHSHVSDFPLLNGKEVLLFVKYYVPSPAPRLQWLGHFVVDRATTVRDLHPMLREALASHRKRDHTLPGIKEGSEMLVFEEISASGVSLLDNSKTLADHRIPFESGGGDILVFQQAVGTSTAGNGKGVVNNTRLPYGDLSDGSHSDDFDWDGFQEPSRGDGTDLPLGGRPLPSVTNYFDYLAFRIKIEFKDKSTIGTPDETKSVFFELLRKDSYATARGVLARYLGNDAHPDHIRFFAHDHGRETAAQEPVRMRDTDELQRVLPGNHIVPPGQADYRIMWYERTEYHISEFEHKDEVKVVWRPDGGARSTPYNCGVMTNDVSIANISSDNIIRADVSISIAGAENEEKTVMKGMDIGNGTHVSNVSGMMNSGVDPCKSFSVLVPRHSKYDAVINQVRIKLRIGPNQEIRMFEVKNGKIFQFVKPEDSVPPLMVGTHECGGELRAEPVPDDETEEALGSEYQLMPVVHLAKDNKSRAWRGLTFFGVPFMIRVKKAGETVKSIRQRILEKLCVPQEEFDSWPLAEVVQVKVMYLSEVDMIYKPNPRPSNEFCTLAIEHKSTAPAKKTTSAISRYADKPLKIRS